MDKEEILERSRAEMTDEGEEFVKNTGRYYGVAALSVSYLVLSLLIAIWGGETDYMRPISILMGAYFGASSLTYYKHSKKNFLLWCVFLFVTGTIISFLEFVFLLIWDLNFIEFLFSR